MTSKNTHTPEAMASLSAMFDGEATEQDIAALLAQNSGVLARQLEGFHAIQQCLHKDEQLAVGLQDNLLTRIHDILEAEGETQESPELAAQVVSLPQSNINWKMMFSGVAMAASVAFMVVFGGNLLLNSGVPQPSLTADVFPAKATQPVATPLAELNQQVLPLDNVKLQQYLRQHAEQATMTVGQGMIPMARVVNYPVQE
ncbi:sigma-E factor negative regulatory protein [Marinomonas posidonica]|uniref:sigma-E factor negative regulatory protein n=1 Tax=Marinomonas posidonica TaxID=936476 RepID=UPI003734DFE7